MNARGEQRLIDINVSHAGQKSLIEQQRFHLRFSGAQTGAEIFEGDLQWLGTEGRDARRVPFDAAELAWVVIQEDAVVERESAVGVRGSGRVEQQLPGHPQVYGERTLVERNDDELAAAPDTSDGPAFQLSGELAMIAGRDQ